MPLNKQLLKKPKLRKIFLGLFRLINVCNPAAQPATISAIQGSNVYFNSSTQITGAIANGNALAFSPIDPSLDGDAFTVSQLISLISKQVVGLAEKKWVVHKFLVSDALEVNMFTAYLNGAVCD